MKKTERVARAIAREADRERYAREEAAMQAFLAECRASLPSTVGDRAFAEAERSAGNTFHIVDWMVSLLAAMQLPISPGLRKALEAMLETLGIDRRNSGWQEIRHLNDGEFWRGQYGYEEHAEPGSPADGGDG